MAELDYTSKRFIDLSRMSYERGTYTFTDFLTLAEQSEIFSCVKELYTSYEIYGGYDGSERCMIRFGREDDLGYVEEYPMKCIHIKPIAAKFAEELGHRDFLGSLMNIGIERHKLGDIIVANKSAYVFAHEQVVPVILDEITRIRHTTVMASVVDNMSEFPAPKLEQVNIQVHSERIDAIIAKAYNLSRSQAAEVFLAGKVFISGKLMENESHQVKADDLISVRGFGRFIYRGVSSTTKKGNLNVIIEKYV